MIRFASVILSIGLLVIQTRAYINTIDIKGKQFVDSVTQEPFFIRGVDYQPGGSSKVNEVQDPLSDPGKCARDIILFQELGINTVRVYSVNPDLNHDVCMSMLGMAGIYLLLDINSPLPNQHLNRYEPWVSYNELYLTHVFKVVEQFSHFNNTLGFFAGNEVINDERSANHSPAYIKSLISDVKHYIARHSPRSFPVGYSAVDDLKFRVSLSRYLECFDPNDTFNHVDFYGINSYQWCGKQTFESSGYDKLVDAYKNFTKPIFFSEFGCNDVLPRTFEEVEALYSSKMFTVFSGGLVYEFNQESNNFGLVNTDMNGNIILLNDFKTLKNMFKKVKLPTAGAVNLELKNKHNHLHDTISSTRCKENYANLGIAQNLPIELGSSVTKNVAETHKGTYVDLDESQLRSVYKFYDNDGQEILKHAKVKVVKKLEKNSPANVPKLRRHRYLNEATRYSKVSTIFLGIIGSVELLFQLSVL